MKNTCVVRVDKNLIASFYDGLGSHADLKLWPVKLGRKLPRAGVYSIRRVAKSIPRSVRVVIVGLYVSPLFGGSVTAVFMKPTNVAGIGYGLCQKFLRELGVTPPPEGKRKTLHLVVTERRAKK